MAATKIRIFTVDGTKARYRVGDGGLVWPGENFDLPVGSLAVDKRLHGLSRRRAIKAYLAADRMENPDPTMSPAQQANTSLWRLLRLMQVLGQNKVYGETALVAIWYALRTSYPKRQFAQIISQMRPIEQHFAGTLGKWKAPSHQVGDYVILGDDPKENFGSEMKPPFDSTGYNKLVKDGKRAGDFFQRTENSGRHKRPPAPDGAPREDYVTFELRSIDTKNELYSPIVGYGAKLAAVFYDETILKTGNRDISDFGVELVRTLTRGGGMPAPPAPTPVPEEPPAPAPPPPPPTPPAIILGRTNRTNRFYDWPAEYTREVERFTPSTGEQKVELNLGDRLAEAISIRRKSIDTRFHQDDPGYNEATPNRTIFMPHAERVRELYQILTEYFQFPNEEIARIFVSVWLIRNGSVVLKGVPGTGKTTLVNLATLLFANDLDLSKPIVQLDSNGRPERSVEPGAAEVLAYLRDVNILATAQMNPDKQPDEIFYETDIALIQLETPGGATPGEPAPGPLPGLPSPSGPAGNPFGRMENRARRPPEHTRIITQGKAVGATQYHFSPEARPIVKAKIKLINEANRANRNVIDVILGMMAEHVVEFLGKPFRSPEYGSGTITMFDYNPHLDTPPEGREPDRAFLDRIMVGLYLPAIPLRARMTQMKQILRGDGKPEELALGRLREKALLPLTYYELEDVWRSVRKVAVPDSLLIWAIVYTNALQVSFFKYGQEFYGDPSPDGKTFEDLGLEPKVEEFVDLSTLVYGQDALQNQDGTIARGENENTVEPLISAMRRTLGFRSLISMVEMLRSWAWLEYALASKPLDDGYIESEKVIPTREMALRLLPYVSDHRINLGVESLLKGKFLNFADFVRYKVWPYIHARQPYWDSGVEAYFLVEEWVRKNPRRSNDVPAKAAAWASYFQDGAKKRNHEGNTPSTVKAQLDADPVLRGIEHMARDAV